MGDSDSPNKLKSLLLPPLNGKSILDVGCNEGFFCFEAIRQGAIRAVGIDQREVFIKKAKERSASHSMADKIDFICTDWENLPEEKFDVVLLLSSLHYADNQQKLVADIMQRVHENGLFILECGILSGETAEFRKVTRGIDERYFPTSGMIKKMLENYAFRIAGNSVAQSGDPVKRFVVHIKHKKGVCLLIGGAPWSGKTTLSMILANQGSRVMQLDTIMAHFIRSFPDNWSGYDIENCNSHLMTYYRELHKNTVLCNKFVSFLNQHLDNKIKGLSANEIICIEGYGINIPEILHRLTEYIENNGLIVWQSSRPQLAMGFIDSVDTENISGWAITNAEEKFATVCISVNNEILDFVETCLPRSDVQIRHPGAPLFSGFSYRFRKKLSKNDSVSVRIVDPGKELHRSPIRIKDALQKKK